MSRLGLALSGVAMALALGAFGATRGVAQQSGTAPAQPPAQTAPDSGDAANSGRDADDWRRDGERGERGERGRWRRDRRSYDDDERGERGRGWRQGGGMRGERDWGYDNRRGDERRGEDRGGEDRRGEGRRGPGSDRWGSGGPRGPGGFGEGSGPRGGMMGRGMGPRMMGRLCGPNGDRLAGAMLDRLERVTQPTDAQRPIFDRLKDAAGKAHEAVKASCPTGPAPITPPGRLAAAEKRLEAMLGAVRTIRPALEEYYGSLSEEQKARLYASRGGRQGWRGRFERGQRDGDMNNRRPDGQRQGWREEPRERLQDGGYGRRGGEHWGGRDRDSWPNSWRGPS